MKRRFPGNQNGPPPFGPAMAGRSRPDNLAYYENGRGGQPMRQRGGPPQQGRFPGRGGPRQPINVGFQGRGRGGPNIPGRFGPGPNFTGRGPTFGRIQGRGPIGRNMGRGPILGMPPNMGRFPGPSSNIPPPPPRRAPVGFQPNSIRPPPPPPPGRPPLTFSQRQPPPRLTATFPNGGVNPPNLIPTNQTPTNHSAHQSNLVHGTQQSPAVSFTSGYPNIPVVSSAAINTTTHTSQTVSSHNPNETAQTSAKPTAQQIDQAWKEFTAPNGMKYYHNAILKESTYTKPITLNKKETLYVKSSEKKRVWKEYEDASSGKKYYSDGVTTTWKKPEDFAYDPNKTTEAMELEPVRKKEKSVAKMESSFADKVEAIAAFKGLLLAKGIDPIIKWNEVAKICSSDTRWNVCEDALTVGERRQALAEYQTKRANELRNLERQEKNRAKEAFDQLLTDVISAVSGFSAWTSRFSDVRATLAKDDRFHAVADEETRESLFLDFCEEYRKRDERKKRNKKREAQDAFLSFLSEKEDSGGITFASTWESFQSSLKEEEKKDERFEAFGAISDSDRQLYFSDFVIELQSAEDDKRRRIRDARRRAEKAQRDAYRGLLRKFGAEGKILPSTRWRSIEDLVCSDESFKLVQAQDRDSPRVLFEDFVDEWDDFYRHERSFLSRLLNPPNKKCIQIKKDTSYDDFTKILLDEASNLQELYGETRQIITSKEPISSAQLYYDELISQAISAQRRPSYESSEDEGEIIEDVELEGGG